MECASGTPGSVRYRVGNGQNGYRPEIQIPDTSLPFRVTEGEHEIVVDHDVENKVVKRIQINGEDLTGLFSVGDRKQRIARGLFGISASMDPLGYRHQVAAVLLVLSCEDIASGGEMLRKTPRTFAIAIWDVNRKHMLGRDRVSKGPIIISVMDPE